MRYRFVHIIAAVFLLVGMGVQAVVSYRRATRHVQEKIDLEMQQAAQDPNKASLLTTMLAYQGNAGGKPTRVVDRNNEYTAQVLLRLGFRWSEPDSGYVNRMLTAISQLGFFDV